MYLRMYTLCVYLCVHIKYRARSREASYCLIPGLPEELGVKVLID